MHHEIPFGIRIAIIDRAFKRRVETRAQKMDLTAVQMRVLGELSIRETSGCAEINQKDLERALQVTHPTMCEIMKRLEKKGFVQCVISAVDRRYKKISSTEKAKHLHTEMLQQDERVIAELCRGLSPEEISAFLAMTDVILGNIIQQD